jgi:hypothetical protein
LTPRRCQSGEIDYDHVVKLEESAAAGFKQLGYSDLEAVSRATSVWASAAMEISRINIDRGLELFATAEEFLKNAGEFGSKFQQIVDEMKPEALFIGILPAILAGDTGMARVLASQASEMSKSVAEKYYDVGTPMRFTYLGLASFYDAFFAYFQSQMDLSNLALDSLVSDDISASAKEAERLLAQADLAGIMHRGRWV